jgi:hypothetical protein
MNMQHLAPFAAIVLSMSALTPAMAAAPGQDTKPIVFGKSKAYKHESGWFSIDMPGNWKAEDGSKEAEAIVTFTDPTGNAALVVDVFPTEKAFSDAELSKLITDFVKERLSNNKKFVAKKAQKINANLYGVSFTYQAPAGSKLIPMTGESFVRYQKDAALSLVTYVIPTEQLAKAKKPMYDMIDSLSVDYDAITAKAGGDVSAFGELVKFTHPKKAFTMLLPAAWDITDNSKTGQISAIYSQPDTFNFAMVEVFPNAKGPYKKADLVPALDDYVSDALENNVDGYSGDEVVADDANTARKTFEFGIEKDGKTTPMVGIVVMKQNGKNVAFLRVIVAAADVQSNADAIGEMVQSLEVNRTAKY